MKWISNSYIQNETKKLEHLLPNNFDYKTYINLYPDLISAGIDNAQKAKEHYLLYGKREGRLYTFNTSIKEKNNQPVPEIWNSNKNLLYFSPNAPDYDMSSGGNRLLEILKILKIDLGYNVWFLCNGYSHKRHIEVVQNLDIPVFLPNIQTESYLDKPLKQALENNIIFDNAIFSWYDIARQYMDIVKQIFPHIKIIVDSVDVHWIREQRGKDSQQLDITQASIDFRKNIEKHVYQSANVVFAITENDKKHIQSEIGYQHNIKILSNIHHQHNIKLGNNIFFIGNYLHGPNIDAANLCIKIYEKFQQTLTYQNLKKKPQLLLVGPNKNDWNTNNSNIKILGHKHNLIDLYKDCNLLLAPLVWGAGIKGKICDAGMCGIPILTSDIGNEGIDFVDGKNALIANNVEHFVNKLTYFYKLSQEKQKLLGQSGKDHLNKIVSIKATKNILRHTLLDKHIVLSIVTFNQPVKLLRCLESILTKTKYSNYTIYITDNGNNTKIKQQIQKLQSVYYNKIIYRKNKKNAYFIEPNNKLIYNQKYKKSDIVLINDDLEILDDYWLNYLYSSVYCADYIAAAGGKTIYPNGTLAEAGAELYNNGDGKNKGRYQNPDIHNFNIPEYTGYCSGCLLYMRRDALNQIGGFSEKLEKMYYEDSEWQYRAHIHGLKTIYDPRCSAIHDEGSSSGTDISSGTKKYQQINKYVFLSLMKMYGCSNIEQYN